VPTDAELDQLRAFVSRATSLLERRLLTSGGLDASWSINFNHATGLRFTAAEPDEEDLRSFMLDFRQFTMTGEPVHLGRIMNVLERRLTEVDLRDHLSEIRQQWQQAQRGVLGLNINDQSYRADRVLDLFVNGYYFHNDPAKRELLQSFGQIGQFLARRSFLDLIVDGVRVVAAVRGLILLADDRRALR